MVQCAVLLLALIIVVVNLVVDLVVAFMDPRAPRDHVKAATVHPGLPLDARAASGAVARPSEARVTLRRLGAELGPRSDRAAPADPVASAVLAPWAAPRIRSTVDIATAWCRPPGTAGGTRDYVLGMLDQVGRAPSLAVHGGRISLVVGVAAVLIWRSLWRAAGARRRLRRGRTDAVIMTVINIMLNVSLHPAARGDRRPRPSLVTTAALGVADGPLHARVARAETRSIGERDFIAASRALGLDTSCIVP